MNIWLVVGGVGVLLLVVVLIGTQRPRRAEDVLSQPTPKPALIDTSGSIAQTGGLRPVLRSIQTGRQTGTLQLTTGDLTASLYFLFGHLFHVTSGALTGEPALQECLSWAQFSYTFDSKAPLPTDETIERPMDEIVA